MEAGVFLCLLLAVFSKAQSQPLPVSTVLERPPKSLLCPNPNLGYMNKPLTEIDFDLNVRLGANLQDIVGPELYLQAPYQTISLNEAAFFPPLPAINQPCLPSSFLESLIPINTSPVDLSLLPKGYIGPTSLPFGIQRPISTLPNSKVSLLPTGTCVPTLLPNFSNSPPPLSCPYVERPPLLIRPLKEQIDSVSTMSSSIFSSIQSPISLTEKSLPSFQRFQPTPPIPFDFIPSQYISPPCASPLIPTTSLDNILANNLAGDLPLLIASNSIGTQLPNVNPICGNNKNVLEAISVSPPYGPPANVCGSRFVTSINRLPFGALTQSLLRPPFLPCEGNSAIEEIVKPNLSISETAVLGPDLAVIEEVSTAPEIITTVDTSVTETVEVSETISEDVPTDAIAAIALSGAVSEVATPVLIEGLIADLELLIPATIPAQLSCNLGLSPTSSPVVTMNVDPVPFNSYGNYFSYY